jgi:hypothetical protein
MERLRTEAGVLLPLDAGASRRHLSKSQSDGVEEQQVN